MKGTTGIRKYTFALFFGAMLFNMCNSLTGSVLSDIMTDYGMNLDHGGMMSLFQALGSVAAILLISVLADRFRKPVILMLAFLVIAASLFLIGGFQPFALFMILYLIFGAAIGVIDVMNNAVLSDLYQENRNPILCMLHGVCGAGAVLMPIFTAVAGTANWKLTYRVVALVVTVMVLLQLVMYRTEKKAVDGAADSVQQVVSTTTARQVLGNRQIWIAAVSLFFFGCSQNGVVVWIVKYCGDVFEGIGAVPCAIGLSAYWAGATLCRLSFGVSRRLDAWRSGPLIIWGGILAGAALLLGVVSGSYIGMLLGVFGFGVLNGATLPRLVGLMNSWYPDKSGFTSSLSFVALYLGFAVSPFLMGIVASAFGMQSMMLLPAAETILSGLIGLALPREKK